MAVTSKLIQLSMDNIRQIGKQIIDMCTSTEWHVYRYADSFPSKLAEGK